MVTETKHKEESEEKNKKTTIEIFNDKKHTHTIKLIEQKKCKRGIDVEELIDRDCSELEDYVVTIGGSCVVFYAEEDGKKYLVKRITRKSENDHTIDIDKKIKEYQRKNGYNYFLDLDFVGYDSVKEKEKNEYHFFRDYNGVPLRYKEIKSVEALIKTLKEFKSFLFSLKILHEHLEVKYTHCEINPRNIIRFPTGNEDEYGMRVIDFGSAEISTKIQSEIISNGIEGYTFPCTEDWYSKSDIIAYCKEIKEPRDSRGNRSIECINVLDLTAVVKVLSYLLCGKERFNARGKWIDCLEGTCYMIDKIMEKANNKDLRKRYRLCDDLMKDIDLLIESLVGDIKTPKAMKLVSMNTCNHTNDNHVKCSDKYIADLRQEWAENNPDKDVHLATIKNLKDSIDSDLLVEININGKNCNPNFSQCSFNQIEDLCLNNKE